MRFAVESWAPDYGSPVDDEALEGASSEVDAAVEVRPDRWAPRAAPAGAAPLAPVLFVDGVRRIDAHVWMTDDAGEVHQGICASYAAGAVRCEGTAQLVDARVERGLFCAVPGAAGIRTRHAEFALHVAGGEGEEAADLALALQRAMGRLEARVAAAAPPAEVLLVDGPLRPGQGGAPHADGDPFPDPAAPAAAPGPDRPVVGYVKTHRTAYGPPVVREVITRLAVGERTPLLLLGGLHERLSWYHRLPGEHRHGWDGIVRLEVAARHGVEAAGDLADRLARTLGRFASCAAKDARAPQNLYPVGALERELRRRMGDPALLYRSLRVAAAGAA